MSSTDLNSTGPALGRAISRMIGWLSHVARIHLTLTDDHPWAQAFVIIEAVPAGDESK